MVLKRVGYGQVEPNQLSAQKTGQIYASLPLDKNVNVLQNGEFMYYDYSTKTVTAEPDVAVGEPMLVFNEIKLYEPFWRTSYKDFAMIRVGENYVTSKLATAGFGGGSKNEGVSVEHTEYPYRMEGFAPRMFKTNVGDVMTTNMVKADVDYVEGDLLTPVLNPESKTMVLEKTSKNEGMLWVVGKIYTMPDGQPGLKLQRVQ